MRSIDPGIVHFLNQYAEACHAFDTLTIAWGRWSCRVCRPSDRGHWWIQA